MAMWQRRVDLNIVTPFQRQYQNGEGSPYFRDHVPWVDESTPAVPGLRAQVYAQLDWLEAQMQAETPCGGGGATYIAGGAVPSVVDLQLYTTLEFMSGPKVNAQRLTGSFDPKEDKLPTLPWLAAWFSHMSAWEVEVGGGTALRAPVQ